jgi:hypothetical protein
LLVSNIQVPPYTQHHQVSLVSYERISAGTFKGVGDKTIPNFSAICFAYSGIKHQAILTIPCSFEAFIMSPSWRGIMRKTREPETLGKLTEREKKKISRARRKGVCFEKASE